VRLDTEPVHGGSDRVEHLGAHVEPSVEQDELGHAIRVVRCEAHPDVGPERMAHDDGAIEIEMVQEPEEIGGVLGQAVPFGGLLAVTTTAQVVRDESVAAAQDVGDRVPGGVVGREPMDRDDRRPTARPFVDRQADSLAPQLTKIVMNDAQPNDLRIRALWCLEGLGKVERKQLEKFVVASHRALRKEALRVARGKAGQGSRLTRDLLLSLGTGALHDSDRLVRQEAIRLLSRLLDDSRDQAGRAQELVGFLANAAVNAPEGDWPRFPNFFRDFERYLVRIELEKHPQTVTAWLDNGARGAGVSPAKVHVTAASLPDRAFAALALGGAEGARRLALLMPGLGRDPTAEELVLIASAPNDSAARAVLDSNLTSRLNLRLLYDNRSRLTDHAALAPLLTDAVRALVRNDSTDANQDLLVKLATGFRLAGLEDELIAAATNVSAGAERKLAALRALRESGSTPVEVFRQFATGGNEAVSREAVAALAAAKSDAAVAALLDVWPVLNPALRRVAVERLASSASSARQLVFAVSSGAIARDELDGYTLDKLTTLLPDDDAVKQLVAELGSSLKPVLRLNGGDGDYVETDVALRGPFTVECWVKLDSGINNQDSILAGPGALDANFHDSRFRVWVGGAINDIVIASKPVAPDTWTHVAFTRDAEGRFRLFYNGELDLTSQAVEPRNFEHLKVGYSNVPGGTAGEFAEFRIWKVCRSPDEIRSLANVVLGAPASGPAREGTSDRAGPEAGAPLLYHGAADSWGSLHGNARIERTRDLPPLETEVERRALEAKFAQFRSLANQPGDLSRGQQGFAATCGICHTVKGQGGKIFACCGRFRSRLSPAASRGTGRFVAVLVVELAGVTVMAVSFKL